MSVFSLVMLAVTFLFALGVSWALVVPFFRVLDQAELPGSEKAAELVQRREQLFLSLEELEEELHSLKISPEAYQVSKAELMLELASCLEQLEQLEGSMKAVAVG